VQALESVTAQTFFDYEVIVNDDDTDRSARAVVESAAADRPDVRFAYHENDQAKGGSGAGWIAVALVALAAAAAAAYYLFLR